MSAERAESESQFTEVHPITVYPHGRKGCKGCRAVAYILGKVFVNLAFMDRPMKYCIEVAIRFFEQTRLTVTCDVHYHPSHAAHRSEKSAIYNRGAPAAAAASSEAMHPAQRLLLTGRMRIRGSPCHALLLWMVVQAAAHKGLFYATQAAVTRLIMCLRHAPRLRLPKGQIPRKRYYDVLTSIPITSNPPRSVHRISTCHARQAMQSSLAASFATV